jgi:hypothetical protein
VKERVKVFRSQNIISQFRQRFVQRDDCFPLQLRDVGGGYTVIRQKLTDDVLLAHLKGEKTIGLYGSPESTTKWLCIDIDDLEELAVREVQNHVRRFRIPFLTEFSGKKGYHIWVFFDKPYPNRIARALSQAFAFNHEVFPKQDVLRLGRLGNLVKAPLGVHQVTGNWCLFLDDDLIPYKKQYEVLERVPSIDAIEVLKNSLPELWSNLGSDSPEGKAAIDRPTSVAVPIIKECVRNAIYEGTQNGSRNRVGHVIASELRRLGLERDQACVILESLWNSINEDPIGTGEIQVLLNSAFEGEEYVYGCKEGGTLRSLLRCVGYDECRFMRALKSNRGVRQS